MVDCFGVIVLFFSGTINSENVRNVVCPSCDLIRLVWEMRQVIHRVQNKVKF
jgi:hypothetical protein